MATPNSFANPNAVVSPTSNSSTKSSPSTNNGANVKISLSFSLYQIFGLDLSLFFEFGFWFFFFFLGYSSIRFGESSQGLQQDQQASRSASNCESFDILSFVSGFRIIFFFILGSTSFLALRCL